MNPYLIPRPCVISYSGGRTSGKMLWEILQAYGGTLPEDIYVLFCNTGKEREETLEFVHECEMRWGVRVVWLEYRYSPFTEPRMSRGKPSAGEHKVVVVNYKTASRKGEPFEAVIQARNDYRKLVDKEPMLPNVVMRFCTGELKIRTKRRYMASLGFTDHRKGYHNAIGLRADEWKRVFRLTKTCVSSDECGVAICPLADAGMTEADVMAFWGEQPFDLKLQSYEGNCDLCFLKKKAKIDRLAYERPGDLGWWAHQEQQTGAVFRRGRPTYTEYQEIVRTQPQLELVCDDGGDEQNECHCTD